jgi:hypothetical protein
MRAYDYFSTGNIDKRGLTLAQVAALEAVLKSTVKFRYLPDSVLVYVPLRKSRERIPTRTISTILQASAEMFKTYRQDGNPLQGSVDICAGMETESRQFFYDVGAGQPENALSLPRIVIGNGLYDYLRRIDRVAAADDISSVLNRRIADRCLAMTVLDEDRAVALKETIR